MDPTGRITALAAAIGDADVVLAALGLSRPGPWAGPAGLVIGPTQVARLPMVEELLIEARTRSGPAAARRWSLAPSPDLDGARPVDVLAQGRWREVRRALRTPARPAGR